MRETRNQRLSMNKEEILSEYFLVETEKTEEMKGWKVVGTIEGCAGQSVSPLLELKTDGDGWLCDFKIKLLHCGLVLASPEYVIDEDELVMEAMEKVWKNCEIISELSEILEKQINEEWGEIISKSNHTSWTTSTTPYYTGGTGTQTWTNTITCSASDTATYNNYVTTSASSYATS